MSGGNRAHGVAVIRAVEGEEFGPRGFATGAAGEFVGELEGHFHGGGAVVGEEDLS
jgi:hypothetical protein